MLGTEINTSLWNLQTLAKDQKLYSELDSVSRAFVSSHEAKDMHLYATELPNKILKIMD